MQSQLNALVAKVVSAGSGIAISAAMTRAAPPETMGQFFIIFSVVIFFATFGSMGLGQIAMRSLSAAQNPDEVSLAKKKCANLAGATFLTSFFVFSLFFLLIFPVFIAPYFGLKSHPSTSLLVSLWGILLVMQNFFSETLRGYFKITESVYFGGAVANIVSSGVLIFLIRAKVVLELDQALIVVVFGMVIQLAIVLSRAGFFFRTTDFLYGIRHGARYIPEGWVICLNSFFSIFLLQSAPWVIGGIVTAQEMASFGVAAKLAGFLGFVSGVLYSVLPPYIVSLSRKGKLRELEEVLRFAAALNVMVMLFPVLGLLVYPGDVLAIVFGNSYEDSGSVLRFLVIGAFFNLATGIRGYVLLLTGLEKIQMRITFFCGFLSVISTFFGALVYGVNGAAIAISAAVVVQCCVELYFVNKFCFINTVFSVRCIFRAKDVLRILNDK